MDSKTKLSYAGDFYTSKKVEDGRKEIIVINDSLPEEVKKGVLACQFELNDETGSFELDYSIMRDASIIIEEQCTTPQQLEELDPHEASNDTASVYTATRLGYLNVNNESEVTSILKECDSDIQTACAVWYETQVGRAIKLLRQFILADA